MVTGVAVNLGLVFSMTPLVVAQARVGEEKDYACQSSKMVQLKGDRYGSIIRYGREAILCAISNRQDQKDVLDRLADILTEGIVKQFP